jgi:hypothetical protein
METEPEAAEKRWPAIRGQPQFEARPRLPARASSGKDAEMHKNATGKRGFERALANQNRDSPSMRVVAVSGRPLVQRSGIGKEVSMVVGAQGLFPPLAAYSLSNHSPYLLSAPQLQTPSPALSRHRLSLFRSLSNPCTFQNQPKPTALHKRSRADWTCSFFFLCLLYACPRTQLLGPSSLLLFQTPPRGIRRNMGTTGSLQSPGRPGAKAALCLQVEEACTCTNGSWMTGERCRRILGF